MLKHKVNIPKTNESLLEGGQSDQGRLVLDFDHNLRMDSNASKGFTVLSECD